MEDFRNTQNIFDDDAFFDAYQSIRNNPDNYNNVLEQPSIMALLPNLANKSVLDLGCGSGDACIEYLRRGAFNVVGMDISEKMLSLAKKKYVQSAIQFIHKDMVDMEELELQFDVIISSLAVHYVADWNSLVKSVSHCLVNGGIFLFSQEHPFITAPAAGPQYEMDGAGNPLYYKLKDYGKTGIRKTNWLVPDVIQYHRSLSNIIEGLLAAGMVIEHLEEPLPMNKTWTEYEKELMKPSFLILRCRKP